jgi:hypothetical protein
MNLKPLRRKLQMGQRKYPPISLHSSLKGKFTVDWSQEYQGEYSCPECQVGELNFFKQTKATNQLVLRCKSCGKVISLSCPVPIYIARYQPNLSCPNPLCPRIDAQGHRGWIYLYAPTSQSPYKCHCCGIAFNPTAKSNSSWMGSQLEEKLQPFHFEEETWDLRHFYEEPLHRNLRFKELQPNWYQHEVKRYLLHLLKMRVYRSTFSLLQLRKVLAQLGQIVQQWNLQEPADISREVVLTLIVTPTPGSYCPSLFNPRVHCCSFR